MKIYITYMKDNRGPYMKIFDTQNDAMDWIRSSRDIQIKNIDRM